MRRVVARDKPLPTGSGVTSEGGIEAGTANFDHAHGLWSRWREIPILSPWTVFDDSPLEYCISPPMVMFRGRIANSSGTPAGDVADITDEIFRPRSGNVICDNPHSDNCVIRFTSSAIQVRLGDLTGAGSLFQQVRFEFIVYRYDTQ